MTNRKLLYICGMGHNGSTILNMALNMDKGVLGVSQLGDLLNPYDPRSDNKNTNSVTEFWISVLDQLGEEKVACLERMHAKTTKEKGILKFLLSKKLRKQFADINTELIQIVLDRTESRVLIDSSKNVCRAIGLTECQEIDVYFLHLVRDVRGLINSHNRRRLESSRRAAYVGSTFHWMAKNFAASLLLPRYAAPNYLMMRYEDFVLSPQSSIEKLEEFLDESLPITKAAMCGDTDIATSTLGFGGNRVLQPSSPSIRFRSGKIENGGAFKSNLFWNTIGWPAKFWGYQR